MLCWHCVLALIALTWLPAYIEGQSQRLMFKGTLYPNNTSLFITDVGDVDNNNVLCVTDLAGCCTSPGRGQWIYPNGFINADGNSLVRNNPSGDDFFRSRGNMIVRLERKNNAIGPTGQYCCQVPTMATPDTDSTMCVILMYVSISGSGDQLVGQTYTLTCQVNAGGETVTPEYQWIKDDTEITDETSATLSFSSLADTDSGGYTCRVTVGDQTSTSASVTIGVAPLMVTLSGSGGAQVAGEDYTLTCQFIGGEAVTPVYQWLKDGSSLAGETSDTLSFSPLRDTDSGGYTCEVTTGSLTATSPSVIITVVAPALSASITANGQPNEGQSYSLTCDVNGDESLAVTSRTFQWDRVGGSGSVSQSSVLTFNTLSRDDDGEYMCTSTFTSPYLTNTQTVTATTMVTINREPTPRLPTSIRNIFVTSSSATIQWMLMDPFIPSRPETFTVLYGTSSEDLSSNSPQMIANSMIQTYSTPLTSLQTATLYYYKVRSRNEFATRDTDVLSFTTNDEMSSAITNLDSVSNDDTLVISWGAPVTPNGAITSYSISIINLKDGSAVRQEIIPIETLSVRQTGLEPGVPYNVSIAAVNRAGPGEFSVSIYFTRELAPDIAPMDVNVDRTSPTVMVVSWTPLSYVEARGFISHYTVAYSPQTSGRKRQDSVQTVTVPGMDSSTVTISNLDPETGYSVLVSGATEGGVGEMSVPVTNPAPERTSGGNAVIGIAIGIVVVVVIVAVIMITVLIIIFMSRLRKKNTHELTEVTYDVVGGQYEVVKKQQQPTPTNTGGAPVPEVGGANETGEYAVIGKGSKETFNLAQCPAYGPITQPKVGGVGEAVVSDM